MLEQEYKNKLIEVERVKTEISELNIMKSGLVREINLQTIEANEKVKKIIDEAYDKAKRLIEETQKTKSEADTYAEATKKQTNDLLHITKAGVEELKEARIKFLQEKEEFGDFKVQHEFYLENKEKELKEIEGKQNERQEALDSFASTLDKRDSDLIIKTKEVNNNYTSLAIEQEQTRTDRTDLGKSILVHNKDKEIVETQRLVNEQVLAGIKISQDKINLDTKANQEALADIAKQKAEIAEQKKTINDHFDHIDKNLKTIEEQKISLNEQEQLLNIKRREVEEKTTRLEELRAKQ